MSEIFIRTKDENQVTSIAGVYDVIAEQYRGTNLIFLDEEDVKLYIDKEIKEFKFVGINKTLPSKLDIVLEPRFSKFFIQAQNGVFGISGDLFVYDMVENVEVAPNISIDKELVISTYLEDPIILTAMKYSELIDSKVEVKANKISLMINNDAQVLLPENPKDSIDVTLSLLKKILQKYSIEKKAIESIDLRYDKPVVKLK